MASSTKEFVKTGECKEGEPRQPIGDRILIRRDPKADTSKGGIILPEQAKQKPMKGTVEGVGDGVLLQESGKRIPHQVKVGDRVLFKQWAGTVDPEDEELIYVTEGDILAVQG